LAFAAMGQERLDLTKSQRQHQRQQRHARVKRPSGSGWHGQWTQRRMVEK
jgi:hypothetical protein